MKTRAFLVGLGLLAASVAPALADSIIAKVISWNPAERTITFEDMSQFASIPADVTVPEIRPGDTVTVDFEALDNGYDKINSVTVKDRAISRRLPPQTEKKG
ncbi:MAG TPA: hypothetical protein VE224_01035 [Pseudolabrys sp.]|jgi:hypothetical protein|nr:hypothetical protein [Pseudolabrys sp.]